MNTTTHTILRSPPPDDTLLFSVWLNTAEISPTIRDFPNDGGEKVLWIHLCAINPLTQEWLENETTIDNFMIDALVAEETRPRIETRKDGTLINIRGLSTSGSEYSSIMASLRIWVSGNLIMTFRRNDIYTIEAIENAIRGKQGPKTPCDFLVDLFDGIFTRIEDKIDQLDCNIAKLERSLAQNIDMKNKNLLSDTRRENMELIRHIKPQKTVLEKLLQSNLPWLDGHGQNALIESHDRIIRTIDDLNEIKERSQIISEEIRLEQADRLNSISFIFSIIATIFLPLSFFTGLLGVNVGGIPGMQDINAFWWVIGLCIIIVVIQLIFFRKWRWF